MSLIAVGVCGYDDNEGLERLVATCWKHVDLIIHIDGPFKNYKGTRIDKGTFERPANMITIIKPNRLEHEKRQAYLDACKEYNIDYLIVTDTDEYFHPDSDWNAFKEEREKICNDRDHLYFIKNYTEISTGETRMLLGLDQPRLIKNPSQIHYLNGHHYQFAVNGTDDAIVAKNTLYSIKLCHDWRYRSEKRMDRHDRYIKWLSTYERTRQSLESDKEKDNRERSVNAGH
jgi:hypothetical protein